MVLLKRGIFDFKLNLALISVWIDKISFQIHGRIACLETANLVVIFIYF